MERTGKVLTEEIKAQKNVNEILIHGRDKILRASKNRLKAFMVQHWRVAA